MSPRPTRVLCIDDNRWIGESIEKILRAHNDMAWTGWLSGAVGLEEAILQRQPDIVLLDIDIPGEDSFGVLDSICRSHPDIRVLMLSGHIRAEYVDRALVTGAWGYISKNEDTSVIVDAIRRAMAGETALSPAVEWELARL